MIAESVETLEAGLPSIDEQRETIKTLVYQHYADGSSSDRACQEVLRIV